jgi:phosphoadenosine phosphosulfate reductase
MDALGEFDPDRASRDPQALAAANAALARLDAAARVRFALARLPGEFALSSSFGAQAAVTLHLGASQQPDMPVVLIDTGYLFPETYRFVDELTERLRLNLKVYQPTVSSAWLEARHGRLWEKGVEGIERYNELRKGEPLQRALRELGVRTWIAGLRRDQSRSRAGIQPLEFQAGRFKLHPIYDWNDRHVFEYLKRHDLPYHPLWDDGYVSIGDWHTTRSLAEAGDAEATRFFGLKRECGIHGLAG